MSSNLYSIDASYSTGKNICRHYFAMPILVIQALMRPRATLAKIFADIIAMLALVIKAKSSQTNLFRKFNVNLIA